MRIFAVSVVGLSFFLPAQEQKSIQGTWTVLAYDQNGQKADPAVLQKLRIVIAEGKMTIRPKLIVGYQPVFRDGKTEKEVVISLDETRTDETTFRLTPEKRFIDVGEGNPTRGIYVLEDDTLTICLAVGEKKKRPLKIPEQPRNGLVRMVLKRAEK
jgi:uncharacterized protein (TIGR03067 family)